MIKQPTTGQHNVVDGAASYVINSVEVSTNGHKEMYVDVEWSGDNTLDYYELRVFDCKRDCLECLAYASHSQRVLINDYTMDLQSKCVNAETLYVELGVAEYNDKGELLEWRVLAAYEPVQVDLYYEFHIFRKNVLEIR